MTILTPVRWAQLLPEPSIEGALNHAGQRDETADQNTKRRWSERFAHACAVAIAVRLSEETPLANKRVLPKSIEGGTEPLTPLGSGTSKRIDVTVSDAMLGLEIGFSLKGLNFRDASSGNFDKNLTGRLYELGDEVRLVHDHLPHAFMVGIFFLPINSTTDKTERANSSFANAVLKLRERTGRLDAALAGQSARCDVSYVGLYAPEQEDTGIKKGVCRFFETIQRPPRRGRPIVSSTLSLEEMIKQVVAKAMNTTAQEWAEAEA